MNNTSRSAAPSGQDGGPLSLDDLFNAEVTGASPQAPAAPDQPGPSLSQDEEPDGFVESDDDPDDVDTAAALGLPENDPEDGSDLDEDDAEGEELDEDQVDGHLPFAPTSGSAASADEAEETDEAAAKKPEEVTFADLGLPADLLKAVTDMGYVTPTAIQREAIPVLLAGRDVVGVAQTGTGKTAAFGLPLLDAVDARDGEVQALVLAPTRELALQSAEAITDMAARSRGLDVVAVYGGAPYGPQIGALRSGAQVVVGTPGRVIDLIDKGALHLEAVRYFVLDEADEMLRMGFAEDVETIAASLPSERRTALFSATMPPAIQAVARQHLNDPARVEVSRQSSTVDTVHQTYAVVPFRHKVGAACRVLATTEAEAAIVFVRTKSTAEDVAIELAGRGIQAAAISGDVPQRERERLVERLRTGTLDVLVATDVAARGLDVDRIGLVVNFDVPREAEAYVHRIGRTGRAGRHGEAVTFLTPKEKGKLRQIERLTGTRLEEITLPSPADVSRHRAAGLLDKAAQRHERGRLEMYTEMVQDKAAELEIEVSDLAATLLALAVGDAGPKTWQERKEEPRQRVRREENVDSEGTFVSATFEGGRERGERGRGRDRIEGKPGASRGGRRHEEGTGTVYRVEVGHRDRVLPGAIVGALANEGGISGSDVGKIDIFQSFSLVEIHTPLSDEQLQAMGRATFGGRELRIRPDQGPGHGWDGSDGSSSQRSQRRAERPRREDGERGGYRSHGRRDGGREDRGYRSGREDRGGWRENGQGGYRSEREDRGGWRENGQGGYRSERGGRDGGREDRDRGYRSGREDRGDRSDRGWRDGRRENGRGGYRSERGGRDGGRGSFRSERGRDRDRW